MVMIVACPHCHTPNRVAEERLNQGGSCGKCKHRLFDGRPVELDARGFEAHANRSDLPLVVDFWAPWCGPCRMMASVIEQAAQTLEPRVRIAKVNTETEQSLAAHFLIRSIPTIAIFRKGQEIARQAGAMDSGTLMRWIRNALS